MSEMEVFGRKEIRKLRCTIDSASKIHSIRRRKMRRKWWMRRRKILIIINIRKNSWSAKIEERVKRR
jgi:hypothetical protein